MKYCRFSSPEGPQYGLVESVAGVEQITCVLPPGGPGLPDFLRPQKTGPWPLAEAPLLAPVQPSKIVCVGRNYREHAREMGNDAPAEPLLFLKPPSSILATGGKIVRPRISQRVDFEGELAVVIQKRCKDLPEDADVNGYIFGYTAANDVTARDLQKSDSQWTRAKGFDTFCPVGPVVTDEADLGRGLLLETRVNGALRQSGNTRDFIFPLDVVLRYISRIMTLFPGDLICTGTPSGVGPLAAGDEVEICIQGMEALRNSVVDGD